MADDVHELEGIDTGRIKDSEVAHGLANKIQAGWERALKAEQVLTEELTDEQKEQLRIVESLPGKYPHAFMPDEDGTPIRIGGETGLQYLLTRPDKDDGSVIVLSKYGYATVGRSDGNFTKGELSEVDFSAVFIVDDKHKREEVRGSNAVLIEFKFKEGGRANYKIHGGGKITAENAPRLKEVLLECEAEGVAEVQKREENKVDVLGLL